MSSAVSRDTPNCGASNSSVQILYVIGLFLSADSFAMMICILPAIVTQSHLLYTGDGSICDSQCCWNSVRVSIGKRVKDKK